MAQQFYSFADFYALRKKYPSICSRTTFTVKNFAVVYAYQNKLLNGVKVDAEEIARQLFPYGKRDVFISHRSRDIGFAHAVQNEIMTTTGLSCFIDSDVWQDMYQIVEPYQQALVRRGASLRDVNRLVSQFTLLLRDSLVQMVERCPIFLFVAPSELLQSAKNGCIETDSPWINLELKEAKTLYLQHLQMVKESVICNTRRAHNAQVPIRYRAPMEFLRPLSLFGLSTLKKA